MQQPLGLHLEGGALSNCCTPLSQGSTLTRGFTGPRNTGLQPLRLLSLAARGREPRERAPAPSLPEFMESRRLKGPGQPADS